MKCPNLTIATRGSAPGPGPGRTGSPPSLGERHPGLGDCEISLLKIKTTGDKILDVPLAKVGGKGLFVKEIEDALLDGRADLGGAFHEGHARRNCRRAWMLGAVTSEREDVRDVLVSRRLAGGDQGGLSQGGQGGNQQPEKGRPSFWLRRPDLEIVSIRGNVQTSLLKKLDELGLEAVVLASGRPDRAWALRTSPWRPGWIAAKSNFASGGTGRPGSGGAGATTRPFAQTARRPGAPGHHRFCRGRGKVLSGPVGGRLPGSHRRAMPSAAENGIGSSLSTGWWPPWTGNPEW